MLPLKPIVTPGMGIAGVILLATGLVYAMIGTKNKWYGFHSPPQVGIVGPILTTVSTFRLQIFFSVSFLASIAVTVLIIYLFNPPVSPALEGAFLVAAVVTGVIFGVLSNVFSEVTEGLGCLLGGFCIGMWFLCLRDGGLIHPQFGRVILLASTSVVGFALSFAPKTRSYALLVSASFAGATAAVLGIDCFSRAGLKEFWLYLWSLNPDLFPLGTHTYPLTRGIRVELAGIVLLFALGLVSQFKLWKLVQARRQKKNANRLKEEEDLEQLETDVGRRIEEDVRREKAVWEEMYGGKPGTGDSTRTDLAGETNKAGGANQDDTTIVGPDGQTSRSLGLDETGVEGGSTVEVEGELLDGGAVLSPDLSQLPFSVPDGEKSKRKSKKGSKSSRPTESRTADRANAGEVLDDDHQSDGDDGSHHTHSDDGSSSDSDSSSGSDESESSEQPAQQRGGLLKTAGMRIKTDDDAESSIAATIDEIDAEQSAGSLSGAEGISPTDQRGGLMTKRASKLAKEDGVAASMSSAVDKGAAVEGDAALPSSGIATPASEVKDGAKAKDKSSKGKSRSKKSKAKSLMGKSIRVQASDDGVSEETPGSLLLKKEHLPDQKITRATRSFRTNEWAKHLDTAEDPNSIQPSDTEDVGVGKSRGSDTDGDAGSRPPSPGVQIGFRVRPQSNRTSFKSPVTGSAAVPGMSSRRSSARMSIRNSSAPVIGSSALSPSIVPVVLEEEVDEGTPASSGLVQMNNRASVSQVGLVRHSSSGMPLPNTLLSKRQSMLDTKLSTVSFANLPLAGTAAKGELENVPLIERRAMMQQQQQQQLQQEGLVGIPMMGAGLPAASTSRLSFQPPSRQTSWGAGIPPAGTTNPASGSGSSNIYNNNNNSNGNRQEALMASWRESTTLAALTANSTTHDEHRRAAMLSDRRHQQLEKQSKAHRESFQTHVMGEMMRTGDMIDAHRSALRRMQSQAKQ